MFSKSAVSLVGQGEALHLAVDALVGHFGVLARIADVRG